MAPSPPSPEQIEQLLHAITAATKDIRLWLGASLFGVLVASCFYGANLVQLYIYATSERRDPLWVILLVVWIWGLDTIHTGFIWSWTFDKLVLDAADITRTLLVFDLTDALTFSVLFSGLLGASVQSFYAYRLYRLARHPWFSVVSWAGSLGRVGLSVVLAITARKAGTLLNFIEHDSWTIHGVLGISVGVDVFSTVAVCILLAKQRDGMQMTSSMISKLTLWTVETGFVTSACALAMLALILVDQATVVPALLHVYAKLFGFSFLVTLNGRERLRRAIASSHGAVVTPLSVSRPAMVSVTHQRSVKEPAFELVGRSFRPDPTTETMRSGVGLAHGDPESPSYRRADDLKAVAPWEEDLPPSERRPPVPQHYNNRF